MSGVKEMYNSSRCSLKVRACLFSHITPLILFSFAAFLILIPCRTVSQSLDETDEIRFEMSLQSLGDTRSFGLEIADVDQDDDSDVFIANYNGPSRLWINMGGRVFVQSAQNFYATPSVSSMAHDAAVADLNGDTFPDVFIAFHHNPCKVFLNDTNGGFVESGQNIGDSDETPDTIQLIDVDNDTDIDAFRLLTSTPCEVLFNDGQANFTAGGTGYGGGNSNAMLLANLNDDNYPDLIISLRSEPNQIWLNDGSGSFSNTGQSLNSDIHTMVAGDIDGDGDQDIVTSNPNQINLWLNQGNSGIFLPGNSFGDGSLHLAFIDAESDGDLDLITAHPDHGNQLWISDGAGSFTSLGAIFGTQQVLSLGVADMDSDSDDDIVFGYLEGSGGNRIYYNESTVTDIPEPESSHSSIFRIHENFPNPFNSSTTILFEVQYPTKIAFPIFDINGRHVARLSPGVVNAGYHEVTWNGRDHSGQQVPTGTYFCKMVVGKHYTETITLLLIK
jgi:FG-GAP-like repeat/FlgD Ig-like domain